MNAFTAQPQGRPESTVMVLTVPGSLPGFPWPGPVGPLPEACPRNGCEDIPVKATMAHPAAINRTRVLLMSSPVKEVEV
jgi:hypothetical protein